MMSEERQTAAAAGTRSYRHLSCSRTRRAGIWGTRRAVLPVLALLLAGGWLRAAAPAPKARWPEVGFRKTCWDCRKGRWAKRRLSVRQCRMQQGHTACDWSPAFALLVPVCAVSPEPHLLPAAAAAPHRILLTPTLHRCLLTSCFNTALHSWYAEHAGPTMCANSVKAPPVVVAMRAGDSGRSAWLNSSASWQKTGIAMSRVRYQQAKRSSPDGNSSRYGPTSNTGCIGCERWLRTVQLSWKR